MTITTNLKTQNDLPRETVTHKTTLKTIASDINKLIAPIQEICEWSEEPDGFNNIQAHYIKARHLDKFFKAGTSEGSYVTDYCYETKTYTPKLRRWFTDSSRWLYDDLGVPPNEDPTTYFKTPLAWYDDPSREITYDRELDNFGMIEVDLQFGETMSVGVLVSTAAGLHNLKHRNPDLYRGLTQLADGTLATHYRSWEGLYEIPTTAHWSERKRDEKGYVTDEEEWINHQDNNIVWWFYEYGMNGLHLQSWERKLYHMIRGTQPRPAREEQYYKDNVSRHETWDAYLHSSHEHSGRVDAHSDFINPLLREVDLETILRYKLYKSLKV